jgi:hypothetical protein
MKTYKVELRLKCRMYLEVEANDAEEAKSTAISQVIASDKIMHHIELEDEFVTEMRSIV